MREDWTKYRIGDIATYINGRAFKPEEWEKNGKPIIRIQNLNDPKATYNYSTKIFESKYVVKKGDLLFAWAASLGTYIWQNEEGYLNQHIFKVEPKNIVDKEYLYYLLNHLIPVFYNKTHGSGMVHITKKHFDNTIILLPPIEKQKEIIFTIKSTYIHLDKILLNLV